MKAKLKKIDPHYFLIVDGKTFGSTMEPHLSASIRHALSLKNCQAIELGYDLDELAEFYSTMTVFIKKDEIPTEKQIEDAEYISEIAFKAGFQKALELMGDKKFSEMNMEDAYYFGSKKLREEYLDFIKTFQQTEWDVEIVMQEDKDVLVNDVREFLENLGDKPLLDADGCLILKRI